MSSKSVTYDLPSTRQGSGQQRGGNAWDLQQSLAALLGGRLLHRHKLVRRNRVPPSMASAPPLPLRLLPGGANQFPGGSCTR